MIRTTARTILLAAPLAFAALTMGAGPALAESPPAPVGVTEFAVGEQDPQPNPNPDVPHGPGDLVAPNDCLNPDDGCAPDDPDDPQPNPGIPSGPDDLTADPPCPTHGGCGDPGDPGDPGADPGDGGDSGDPGDGGEPGTDASSDGSTTDREIPVPTRIDTGAGGSDGLELGWVLASGAVVTAVGTALARRRAAHR